MIFSLFKPQQRLHINCCNAATRPAWRMNKRLCKRLTASVYLLAVTLCQPALANSGNTTTQPLDLNQALQYTLKNNAALQLYPYQHQQALAWAEQAAIKPQTQLTLDVENILGNGQFQSLDNAEITLTFSQTIELGGKLDNRVAYADASAQQQHMEFEMTRLDVLAETSRRYYSLLQIQALQALLEQRLLQEQNAHELTRRRAKAGALGNAAVAKMALRAQITAQQLAQLQAQQQLARLRLSAMWQQEPNFTTVAGSLNILPVIPERDSVLMALKKSPVLMQQQALARLADAQLLLAQSLATSNLDLGLGIRHFEGSGDQALNVSLSMPLAFSNPNRGRIKAAQAGQAKLQHQQQLQLQQLRLQLIEMQLQMQQLANEISAIETQLLPQAMVLRNDTQMGFSKGRYSVLQWVDAQAEVFTLQQQRLEKSARLYLTLLELERITGQALNRLDPVTSADANE